jgi:glycosyltransferase involved in cell wall biosynthesis
MDISVIIPVYNEEDNVKPLYQSLTKVLFSLGKSYEIVFIDDGSQDNTLDNLKSIELSDDHVSVISFAKNYGQTAALDAGFKAANGDIVVTMDGDLQNDPADIPLLLGKIDEGYDMVSGWRKFRNDPWLKIASSLIANFIRNLLSNESIKDTGCMLKACRREFLKSIKFFNGLHRFLPTLVKMEGGKVTEVVVSHHPRKYGYSKYNIRRRLIKPFMDLLIIIWMKKNKLDYQIKTFKKK